jgi:hypothetical protein
MKIRVAFEKDMEKELTALLKALDVDEFEK